MTATLEAPTQARPSLADELKRIADWLTDHDAIDEVSLVSWPPSSSPDRPFRVFITSLSDFKRLFAGREAKRTESSVSTRVEYSVTVDGIAFECSEYTRDESKPVTTTVAL